MNIVAALPRIAPVLARHALGYADLATEELQDAGALLRRRALATAMYAIAIIAGEAARRERRKSARLFHRLRSAWITDRETLREVLALREARS